MTTKDNRKLSLRDLSVYAICSGHKQLEFALLFIWQEFLVSKNKSTSRLSLIRFSDLTSATTKARLFYVKNIWIKF